MVSMSRALGGVALLLLPHVAQAKLVECAGMPNVTTGIPVGGCDMFTNTECILELRYGCDLMYPAEQYSEAGIMCGFAGSEACTPEPNVSFAHPDYSQAALDAVNDHVASILPRGGMNAHGALFFPNVEATELYIAEPTQMNLTFVGEGGCQRNSLGMTLLPGDENPRNITLRKRKALLENTLEFSIIFPNVDFRFCQCDHPDTPSSYDDFCTETKPPLQRGATTKLKPDFRTAPEGFTFPADVYVVFFVVPDGFDLGLSPDSTVYLTTAEQLLFSTPELNDPDFIRRASADVRQHTLAFRGPEVLVDGEVADFSDEVFFAFEDRRRFEPPKGLSDSNNDFEDVVFFVSTDIPLVFGEPSQAPSDVDDVVITPADTPTMAPSLNLCAEGVLSDCGNVCCAAGCGMCGGCECASNPLGADMCCPGTILFGGMECVTSSDVACIIDDAIVCPTVDAACRTV